MKSYWSRKGPGPMKSVFIRRRNLDTHIQRQENTT